MPGNWIKRPLHAIIYISFKIIFFTGVPLVSYFNSQAQEMAIRIYAAKDGLPSSFIFSTYQDKLGYLWVGSPNGLSRFDGKNFTNYGLSDGLPDTRTQGGFMDSRLRYWATTIKGVAELKGHQFISYRLSDSQNIRWIYDIIETRQGEIWSVTDVGVYRFQVNRWQKIQLYPGYENHRVRRIIETNEGLYINFGDILVFRKNNGSCTIVGSLKEPAYYYNYLSSSAGRIFISTLDGLYEIIDNRLVRLPGKLGKSKDLYTYLCDSQKRFWIADSKKGIRLIVAGDTTDGIPIYQSLKGFLPQHISEDHQGNVWISSGRGLLRISEKGFKIFKLPVVDGKTAVFNILHPPTSPMLINNGTLIFHTIENGVFRRIILQPGNDVSLPNNELIIDNCAFDGKNRYWYLLRGAALAMQDRKQVYSQSRRISHLGDEVFDVAFDNYRKKIIVAIKSQKFPCQFDDSTYNLMAVKNAIEIKGEIRQLHQCSNGTILFTTDQGLVYSIDKQNICKLQLNEFNGQGQIAKLNNDPSGDVWIVYSGRGLRCYSWQKDSLVFKEQLTRANGLPNDNVFSMCFDNSNNLWVYTSHVTVFSKKSKSGNQPYQIVSVFGEEDLQLEDFYGGKLTRDNNGNIWLSAGGDLICFFPDKVTHNPPAPAIQIENIKLNLRQTNWGDQVDSLSGIFQIPVDLQLSHENNTIGVYFKGISSSGTDGLMYSYLLDGLENVWSNPSSDEFVTFVNIPPGEYTFKVKARLPNTSWSGPAVFSFRINKAFWQTWWFLVLTGMTSAAGIYILFRFRLKQKIKLLEMRNRISRDLHDEIGASMSGINLLSQMAAEKLDNNHAEEASEYLFKVKNYTQDVIEKLSDMVWVFNPQNDSIEKLLQRLKSFAIAIASSKNIKIHFITDKESEVFNLTISQRKAIYLISKEAFNNIFKYAASKNIYYKLHAKGSRWKLEIQDDGKGFIPEEHTYGNGLRNMQSRAAEIGANFYIQSQPDAGTTLIVDFKYPK